MVQGHSHFAPELVALAQQGPEQFPFASFLNQITQLVKQNKLSEALVFYDKNRNLFADNANELLQADSLMQRLRAMLQKNKTGEK